MKDTGKVNKNINQAKLNSNDAFDKDFYSSEKDKYNTYIKDDEELELDEAAEMRRSYKRPNNSVPNIIEEETKEYTGEDELLKRSNQRKIVSREDDYRKKRLRGGPSPERYDPLKDFDRTPDSNVRTYKDIMLEQMAEKEKTELLRQQVGKKIISDKKQTYDDDTRSVISEKSTTSNQTKLTNRSDWDKLSERKWDSDSQAVTPRRKRWDLTPVDGEATPRGNYINNIGKGDTITPTPQRWNNKAETPRGRTKWDETPKNMETVNIYGATPTPQGAFNMATPSPGVYLY
jgi:hypothetical protein